MSALTVLHWKRWDDEWVVYDDGSGQTYQVDALTAALLLVLEEGPAPLSGLAQQVAVDLEIDAAEPLPSRLEETLSRLRTVGWVELLHP